MSIADEQFRFEDGIDVMHDHDGYRAWSVLLRRELVEESGRILDLGCNTGRETLQIAQEFAERRSPHCSLEVYGFDYFSKFVETASARFKKAGMFGTFVQGDANKLHESFSEGFFDCVYSNNSMEHFEFPGNVVGGVWRILKPGGKFVAGFPLDGYGFPQSRDEAHVWRPTFGQAAFMFLQRFAATSISASVVDTMQWNWPVPPSCNKMAIIVCEK